MKCYITLLVFLLLSISARPQAKDYRSRIKVISQNIEKHFSDKKAGLYFETTDSSHRENLHSWLWPLCALIQAANEVEVINPGKQSMRPIVLAIDQYYNSKPPAPAYQDYVFKERASSRFYDDNEWIAIAYLDAYNRNKNQQYLTAAEMIYNFLLTGIDSVAGGGMYWKEGDNTTKNTCSNGPGILVALQLYRITGDQKYMKSALSLYNWTNKYLQSPEGIYYDAVKIPGMKIDKAFYTYNTGTMLQANALLYSITKEGKYLRESQRIAKAGRVHFFKNQRLPPDYWFNAVMLRGYLELYKLDKNPHWIDFFKDDAERVWKDERDEQNLLGPKKVKSLIDQAAMMEIYSRLEQIKNE